MTTDLLTLTWNLGVFFLLLSIIEMISVHSFWTVFYRVGIPVFNRTLDINTADLAIHPCQTIKKSEGKFQFSADNRVYFTSRIFFFRLFRFVTPFPLKIVGTTKANNKIDLVGRLPIGMTMFILCWLFGWTVVAVSSEFLNSIAFGLIGWGFVGIMIIISYWIEKQRVETMIEELVIILTEDNN
jgi:hypothetical protein